MGKVTRDKFKVYEGVFDEFTLNTLEFLRRKNYFDELGKIIRPGKEADPYIAFKDDEIRVIKIYRVTSANFKKISSYINRDFRFKNIKGNLRKCIFAWVQKEYRNLSICHKAHMNVPFAYKQASNVIVMEYLPGTLLKDFISDNPKELFDAVFEQMYLLKNSAKLIHGDLSEYNIIVSDDGVPFFIDFGQAMSVKNDDDLKTFYDLYERDVKIIVDFFNKRYSLDLDFGEIMARLDEKE